MLPRHRKISRRDFLKVSFTAGGALLITACAPEMLPAPTITPVPSPLPTLTPTPEPVFESDLFIRIEQSGKITLRIHRSEMGQGVRTSLAMILAEELEADWEDVHVEQMDAVASLNQITSGSGSILISYTPLREAGATALAILIQAAAQTWNVPLAECKAEKSKVIHVPSGKQLGYGELVHIAQGLQAGDSPLKDPKDFTLIGTSVKRVDDPDIVTGMAIYGLDVRLPGMLFATVARCPVIGGKLVDYDSTQAESVTGVKSVVKISNGVAVVAYNTWAAMQGRAALKVNWNEGSLAELSTESIRQKMIDSMNRAVAKEKPTTLKTLEAIYETPYLAHATMEPMNCVADVRADGCDIWAPTQNPADVQSFVTTIVRVPTNVHVTLLGGGFGRRLEVDFAMEAAQISKAVGVPVQVVWSREDDIQHDFYRQQTYHWLRAGWDAQGQLSLWRHFIAGQGINGIAYRVGKEVLDEGVDVLYNIPDHLSQSLLVSSAVPTGPWRGVMSAPNAFANECFFDEVAAALKKDPLEFRLELLDENSALRPVFELAATKANWDSALSEGHGRGIAGQVYHQVAVVMIAEVSVEGGELKVHKVVCALNCGRMVNPDMVVQQIEGGVAFGLTSLLNEITYDKGRVLQSNFHDYPLLQLKDMPEVEVYVIPSEADPQGLGEMGVPPIVPAVLNAIFNATGKRIRHTPIRAEDL
jgi:isoquinoline 1-oxidoreductase subunit beta